ncbi:MAG: lactate dehydrogenase [Rhodospirillales bacterium]|nr:lactate dehydrogenase [Rhodospirillales bacterium]
MNYRHAYHAGNHGDVLKHAVLAASIERLHEKPTPVFMLDTHAGIGTYDLSGVEAGKTEEWRQGIGPVLAARPPALSAYCTHVESFNRSGELTCYPGSPAIAAAMMRAGDRLVLSELHPDDAETLRHWAYDKSGVAVHQRDAYESIKAFLPPREGRGLVIVDPPYEVTDEYDRLAKAIVAGHRRWPGGRWMIWHPVKDRAPVWRLMDALMAGGVEKMLAAELLIRPADGVSLAGSGLILVNPPFGLENWLAEALPQLQAVLAPQHGSHALRWLGTS